MHVVGSRARGACACTGRARRRACRTRPPQRRRCRATGAPRKPYAAQRSAKRARAEPTPRRALRAPQRSSAKPLSLAARPPHRATALAARDAYCEDSESETTTQDDAAAIVGDACQQTGMHSQLFVLTAVLRTIVHDLRHCSKWCAYHLGWQLWTIRMASSLKLGIFLPLVWFGSTFLQPSASTSTMVSEGIDGMRSRCGV